MKLLHTGDLHLGKNLHETSLLDDQACMLDRLADELGRDDYAALLVAGDVYDRTVPPAEAVALFSGFLVRLRQDFPDLDVCIIPGNHDSAQRLSYADGILGQQRIHIICHPEQSFTPIIATKGKERLALFLLPFLSPGTLQPPRPEDPPGNGGTPGGSATKTGELDFGEPGRPEEAGDGPRETLLVSQADLAREAARRFSAALATPGTADIPSVLVAHLFTVAGRPSESERLFLGSAEQVSPSLFSRFSYVALGHLHRSQKVTDRMYYSGSPLAYAFDEAGTEKSFLKVEIDTAAPGFPVAVTPIPVRPARKLTRLSGAFADFYAGTAFDRYASDYLEITLTDGELVVNPMNLLRPKFPWLLSLKQGSDAGREGSGSGAEDGAKAGPETGAEARDPTADFSRFEEMLYGTVDPEKKKLFAELLSECADEA